MRSGSKRTAAVAAAVLVAFTIGACGSDSDEDGDSASKASLAGSKVESAFVDKANQACADAVEQSNGQPASDKKGDPAVIVRATIKKQTDASALAELKGIEVPPELAADYKQLVSTTAVVQSGKVVTPEQASAAVDEQAKLAADLGLTECAPTADVVAGTPTPPSAKPPAPNRGLGKKGSE